MKNKIIFYKIYVILIVICFISCSDNNKQHNERNIQGELIYIAINSLMYKYNLKTREKELLIRFPRDICAMGKPIFLSNNKYIIEDLSDGLYEVNVESKGLKFMIKGTRPVFIQKYKKIMYYAKNNGKKEYKLFIVHIDSLKNPLLVSNIPKIEKPYREVVPISEDEVVFKTEDNSLCIYNVSTNLYRLIKVQMPEGAFPILWVKSIKKLLMSKHGGGRVKIYLIDLDENTIQECNTLIDANITAYVEKYNLLLFYKVEYGILGELGRVSFPLFAYFFDENITMKIDGIKADNFIYVSSQD